jgi:hypothetical protein
MNFDRLRRLDIPHLLFGEFFVPVILLTVYLVAATWWLPAGVNQNFSSRTLAYISPLAVLASLLLGVLVIRRKITLLASSRREAMQSGYVVILLLPLFPVVTYIINNLEILNWAQIGITFIGFAVGLSLPVLLVPFLLNRWGLWQSAMAIGVAYAFLLMFMASLSAHFVWHKSVSMTIALPLLVSIYVFIRLMLLPNLWKSFQLFVVLFFLVNPVLQFLSPSEPDADEGTVPFSDNRLLQAVQSSQPVTKPNIYLLVYDAYVPAETLLEYGIDNLEHEKQLEALGFKLYSSTYSIGATTLVTMNGVLNSSADTYGNVRRATAGGGVVQTVLQGFGYKTYGVFGNDYFFRGHPPLYDYFFPPKSESESSMLTSAILEGEFRFDVGFSKTPRPEYLQQKATTLAAQVETPRFLYSHSGLPGHTQNSGMCLEHELNAYRRDLDLANFEMLTDIANILENDPNAIVVIAGDHGPYLTKNCTITEGIYDISEITRLDVQDRFGTFLAIYWPSNNFERYDEIIVLQDVFPAIFAYMFEDESILDARVKPAIVAPNRISGVTVIDGIIYGGVNDGEPLFLSNSE